MAPPTGPKAHPPNVPARVLAALDRSALPALIYDLPALTESVRGVVAAFPSYFFPMKCNPHPEVLRTVLEAGGGFSARSVGEVRQAAALGAGPGRVSFTGWGLGPTLMGWLLRRGAAVILDSAREVRAWLARFPGFPFGVRILAGSAPAYLNAGFTSGEIGPMLDLVRRSEGRLWTVQVHFPHDSPTAQAMIRDWEFLPSLLRCAFGGRLESLRFLNLGGGWPGSVPGKRPMDPAEVLRQLGERVLPDLRRAGFGGAIQVEPGRFVAAPCGWLA